MTNQEMRRRGLLGGRPKKSYDHLMASDRAARMVQQAKHLDGIYERGAWLCDRDPRVAEHILEIAFRELDASVGRGVQKDLFAFRVVQRLRQEEDPERNWVFEVASRGATQFILELGVLDLARMVFDFQGDE